MDKLFPTRLRTLRKDKDKTQLEMSVLLNVQRSTYGEYERGKITPPIDKINFLADYFGVSVDWLLGNTNFQTHEERGEADPLDISKQIKQLLDYLQDKNCVLSLDGQRLDDESREILLSALQSCLKTAQFLNKK